MNTICTNAFWLLNAAATTVNVKPLKPSHFEGRLILFDFE